MARPWRIRYAGAKYHVTVRGNGRRAVFHGTDDYKRFLKQLSAGLEKDGVILYAYAVLENHYHLLLETPHGNVQRFMQRLNTAYSMYHRYKHAEPGHCFQGRYGAKLVAGDTYIAALTRYIHLNPIKTAAFAKRSVPERVRALNNYPWSSYRGYVDGKRAEELVDYRWLDLMGCATRHGNRRRYRRYVERFIVDKDEALQESLKASRYAIGDERFIEQVESDLADVREDRGVYGDINWPEGKAIDCEAVMSAVAEVFGVEPGDLRTRAYAARTPRKVALELCCRYSHQSQRAVGEHFGYRGNGSVMKQRQRLTEMLGQDKTLARKFRRIEKALAQS